MKVSLMKADTDFFKDKNPNFHNFLKSYADENLEKQPKKNKSLKPKLQGQKSTSTVITNDKNTENNPNSK